MCFLLLPISGRENKTTAMGISYIKLRACLMPPCMVASVTSIDFIEKLTEKKHDVTINLTEFVGTSNFGEYLNRSQLLDSTIPLDNHWEYPCKNCRNPNLVHLGSRTTSGLSSDGNTWQAQDEVRSVNYSCHESPICFWAAFLNFQLSFAKQRTTLLWVVFWHHWVFNRPSAINKSSSHHRYWGIKQKNLRRLQAHAVDAVHGWEATRHGIPGGQVVVGLDGRGWNPRVFWLRQGTPMRTWHQILPYLAISYHKFWESMRSWRLCFLTCVLSNEQWVQSEIMFLSSSGVIWSAQIIRFGKVKGTRTSCLSKTLWKPCRFIGS